VASSQGFTRVVSLLASTHNLHAYDELHLEWSRFAMPLPPTLATSSPSLSSLARLVAQQ